MTVKFTNNASSTVATGINSSATSLTVADASTFPSLSGADDYCYLTIQQATGSAREVVKATALSSNTFTIVRAQDNTTAGTWSSGDVVELRLTAALLQDVIDQATVEGIKTNFQYVPTANQTAFDGADNSGDTMIINDAELINVYMNGVRLVQGSDYTVSSANNRVTLATGATTADVIDIEVFGNFTGQSGAAVAITGGAIAGTAITTGSINNTPIGATQANTVAATTLTANTLTTTGNATFSGTIASGAITTSDSITSNDGSGSVVISGDSSSNTYIASTGEIRIRPSGTTINKFVIGSSGNLTTAGTITSGAITSSGDIDTAGLLKVGVNDTEYANNYLRFKSAGDAFFDHHTTGQKLRFRVSNSSALDTTPLILNSDGTATFSGSVTASDEISITKSGQNLSLNTPSGSQNAWIQWKDNGTAKWELGKNTANNFFLYSYGASGTVLTVDNSGSVGIGNSTVASTRFAVTGTVVGANIETTSSNAGHEGLIVNRQNSDGTAIAINKAGTTVGSIGVASSRVYIGTDDTGLRFTNDEITPFNPSVSADRNGTVDLGGSSTRFKNLYLSQTALVGSGSSGVGGTPADVNGTEIGKGYINLNRDDTASAAQIQFGKNGAVAGSIVTTTSTTYNTTSDRRLKTDIETITDATDKLMAMNPVSHKWKADPDGDATHGFIAQEMMEIVPEAVSGDPDSEEMMSMDYGRITPVIVAALQAATKEIEKLKIKIEQLEANQYG